MGQPKDKYASPFDKGARKWGIGLTILFHVALLFIGISSGLPYIYPPPQEQGILLEFEAEEPKPIQAKTGSEPRANQADSQEEIRLVQKSEAPLVGSKENNTVETTIGEEGDVPAPEPKREFVPDKRALFSSNKSGKQDTLAPQTSSKISDRLKAGHPEGNTIVGSSDGTPTARLEGRSIMGNLPVPEYGVEKSGNVVVEILVDQYGKVTKATPGVKGTTVQDATLWNAAKKAALEARFNISENAPVVQKGTITYVFRLR